MFFMVSSLKKTSAPLYDINMVHGGTKIKNGHRSVIGADDDFGCSLITQKLNNIFC